MSVSVVHVYNFQLVRIHQKHKWTPQTRTHAQLYVHTHARMDLACVPPPCSPLPLPFNFFLEVASRKLHAMSLALICLMAWTEA